MQIAGQIVSKTTVNGECNHALLNESEAENMDKIWFQQNAAICHTWHATIDTLWYIFENQIIDENGDGGYLSWSYDLPSLDNLISESGESRNDRKITK